MENSSEKTIRSKGFHPKCDKPKYAKTINDYQKVFGTSNIISKNLQGHFFINKYDINSNINISCDNCLNLFKAEGK